jgi:hypothetical protein
MMKFDGNWGRLEWDWRNCFLISACPVPVYFICKCSVCPLMLLRSLACTEQNNQNECKNLHAGRKRVVIDAKDTK